MNPTELEPHQLMQRLADFMEAHKIAYRIVGSMASMVYGEPRFTNDVDIVVELRTEHVPALCAAFAPGILSRRACRTRCHCPKIPVQHLTPGIRTEG